MYQTNIQTKSRTNRRRKAAATAFRPLATLAITALLGATLGATQARAQDLYRYHVTEFDPTPFDTTSYFIPGALSEKGKVTGTINTFGNGSGYYGLLWRPDVPNGITSQTGVEGIPLLPTTSNFASNYGVGISEYMGGTVVGSSSSGPGVPRAYQFIAGAGSSVDLGVLSGYDASYANAISEAGVVIGQCKNLGGSVNLGVGFVKLPGQGMVGIGSLNQSDTNVVPYAINNLNQIVGQSAQTATAPQTSRAFLYRFGVEGAMIDLGLPPGYTHALATGINDREQIVGNAYTPGVDAQSAFIWTRTGGIKNLPPALDQYGGAYTFLNARDINNNGQILGSARFQATGYNPAQLYSSQTGWQDVNALVEPNTFGLGDPRAINDAGQMLVAAPGDRAVLLTPKWHYGFADSCIDPATNKNYFLWRNEDTHQFAVWRVAGGTVEYGKAFSAVEGYNPVAVAMGKDGKVRLLLRTPNDRAAIWTLAPGTLTVESAGVLPAAAGYSPQLIAVGANDNTLRVGLWNKTTRTFALWRINEANQIAASGVFRNIKDYSPASLAVDANGLARLLLKADAPTGKCAVWTFRSDDLALESGKFLTVGGGDKGDWDAMDIAVGTDNKVRVAWKNRVTFKTAVWTQTVANYGATESAVVFSAIPHVASRNLAVGNDGKMRLLWQYDDGRTALWRLSNAGALEAGFTYKADK